MEANGILAAHLEHGWGEACRVVRKVARVATHQFAAFVAGLANVIVKVLDRSELRKCVILVLVLRASSPAARGCAPLLPSFEAAVGCSGALEVPKVVAKHLQRGRGGTFVTDADEAASERGAS